MSDDELRFYPTASHIIDNVLINSLSLPGPRDVLLSVMGQNGERMVAIRRDGTVEYGPGVELDAASETFWRAIAQSIPGPMRGCPDPAAHRERSA